MAASHLWPFDVLGEGKTVHDLELGYFNFAAPGEQRDVRPGVMVTWGMLWAEVIDVVNDTEVFGPAWGPLSTTLYGKDVRLRVVRGAVVPPRRGAMR